MTSTTRNIRSATAPELLDETLDELRLPVEAFGLGFHGLSEGGDLRFIASLMTQRYPDSWGDTETGVEADTVKLEVSSDVKRTWPE